MVTILSCVTEPSSFPAAHQTSSAMTDVANCEPIQIPMCQQMPYNATRMPNLLGMADQEDALLALEQFRYLPEANCSPYLVFFLCVIYTPICTSELPLQLAAIPPCRQVCHQVRTNCEPIMNKMGSPWPRALDCRQYPDVHKGVCLTPEAILKQGTAVKNPENCPCFRHPKLKQRLYHKRKFDFAIRGKVEWTETFGSLTLTSVEVIEVFKEGQVPIFPISKEILMTNTSCGTCPRLDPGREYFLLGHEDVKHQSLLYTHLSVGLEWRKKYAQLIMKWEKERKNKENKRTSNTSGLDTN